MPSFISPYALLCASKPKPVPTLVTPYDMFSVSRSSSPDANTDFLSSFRQNPPHPSSTDPAPIISSLPAKRTHYISDIHARHTAASKKTVIRKI